MEYRNEEEDQKHDQEQELLQAKTGPGNEPEQ